MPSDIEVCHVRRETKITGIPFFSDFNGWYVAQVADSSGTKTIAQTDEFVDGSKALDEAYQKMIQELVNDGWEVMTTDEDGVVTSLKRHIGAIPSAGTSPADLLKQLASLKDAGILTEQEFQAKKAEILKRM